ncbi:hypothetical protein EIN_270800 [Entamoeba invadens IP1]|uniref:CXXC-rich protein n=1 Tax=Entamoeba invadens IP1 TaxID=370355 RepID=A0A0A1U6D0_ENTIV|nr:hypothetical protein EIN_270800 [Entamoeba invadens IP1]ELP89845.1 hypothetical protein EIN_270800 [Entamoeba invadens IP1]|eukprot:XP_004256616.1 hypothetical protein EIN_270800 [Entamoeba invadens IP1]
MDHVTNVPLVMMGITLITSDVTDCQIVKKNDDKNCYTCISGYYPDNEGKCQKGTIRHCSNYINKNLCVRCLEGMKVVGTQCVKINGCLISYAKTCEKCEPGMSLNNSECQPCASDKCIECKNPSICSKCLKGYTITTNGGCKKCEEIQNCISCANDKEEWCTSCSDNYRLVDNQCHQKIEGCYRYNDNPKACDICSNGYTLNNGTCIKCTSGCYSCDSNGQNCLSCFYGYTLNGTTCIKCTDHCGECLNDLSKCFYCSMGYYLSNNSCVDCEETGCPNLDTDTCNKCSSICFLGVNSILCKHEACTVYNESLNICTECQNNYFLDEDYSCKKCDYSCNYYGGCVGDKYTCLRSKNKINNCILGTVDGKCKVCEYRYTLSEDKTSCDKIGYCRFRDDDGNCMECYIKLYDTLDYYYTPNKKGECYIGMDYIIDYSDNEETSIDKSDYSNNEETSFDKSNYSNNPNETINVYIAFLILVILVLI